MKAIGRLLPSLFWSEASIKKSEVIFIEKNRVKLTENKIPVLFAKSVSF